MFFIRREGKSLPTGTYFITFSRPTPPAEIKIGYLKVNADVYIPNPLWCFRCQKCGHGKMNCKKELTCFRCGQTGHDGLECQEPHKCANCDGNHMATSRGCPLFLKEKEVQRLKTEKKLTYPEAQRLPHLYQLARPMLPWLNPLY